MTDIVLYNNKKYKLIENNRIKKKSKSKFVLYHIYSCLYGNSYILISPKEYDKLNKLSDIKLSYYFLDGTYISEEDENLWVKNDYFYDNARDLISKLKDIQITEYCLNEYIWAFSSYYSFIFKNIKISFKFNKKKYKFKSLQDFYKFIFNDPYFNKQNKFDNNLISFSNKKYSIYERKKIIDKDKYKKVYSKIKNKPSMYSLSNGQFVHINPKLFKDIDSMYVNSKLIGTEYEDDKVENIFTESEIDIEYDNFDIMILYILACSPHIVSTLNQSISELLSYSIKNEVISINGKNSSKNFDKIFNKYFIDIENSLIDLYEFI